MFSSSDLKKMHLRFLKWNVANNTWDKIYPSDCAGYKIYFKLFESGNINVNVYFPPLYISVQQPCSNFVKGPIRGHKV